MAGQAPRTEPARSDVQDRIVPLSGNPYFTVIVGKSQIHKPFQLVNFSSFLQLLPAWELTQFMFGSFNYIVYTS